ncbi:MAG: hypothetical protein CL610_17625 [Anaerolineaceae bacterium]|nr:hypothetical protein [Anaerolineaceae bacterium]
MMLRQLKKPSPVVRLLWLYLAFLAGCTTASDPAEASPWGEVLHLGAAPQGSAPALWVQPTGDMTSAWVGASSSGVHQDARLITRGTASDVITLPLPPVNPYAQALLPARDDNLHLMWLDKNPDGELRLYAALLSPGLGIERGPMVISSQTALRYAAIPSGSGEVFTIWSGGHIAEPSLYAQTIDSRGIPGTAVRLTTNADWPALFRANDGVMYLLWLNPENGTLYEAQLAGDQLTGQQAAVSRLGLQPGDRLHDLTAALDATHFYAFWNITRVDGELESWVVARPLDHSEWGEPYRIGIGAAKADSIQTGFNSGFVSAVDTGENWLRWAAPMPGQYETLPLAGGIANDLVIVYLREGEVVGYQRMAPLRALVGSPLLRTDQDRYLYLAWSEPAENGLAALQLLTSRP